MQWIRVRIKSSRNSYDHILTFCSHYRFPPLPAQARTIQNIFSIPIKEPNPMFVIDLVWCNSKRILIFENDVEYYEYWQQESDSHHSSSCFWKTDINPFWNNTMGYFAKLLQNDTFLSIRLPRILDSICHLEDKMDGHRNTGNVFRKKMSLITLSRECIVGCWHEKF